MDDLSAFDRQLGDVVLQRVGPTRPVDDAAIFAAITAARTPKGMFASVFSVARLAVAAAIVALFGGMLLVGVLPRPSDHSPAAVTGSPDPSDAARILPGVDLVTEEVEPGVYRVLSDGTGNDLAIHATVNEDVAQVIAGPDGSVWVRDRQWEGEDRLLRLGTASVHDASRLHDYRPDISVDPDGTLWALGDSTGRHGSGTGEGQLLSLNDGEWTVHAVPGGRTLTGIETPADGSVWASVAVGTGEGCPGLDEEVAAGGRLTVARLVDGEWFEEDVEPALRVGDGGSLAVGPDGAALLATSYFNSCHNGAWLGIVERDEDGWAPSYTADPEAEGSHPGIGPMAIGSDGTAWAYQDLSVNDTADATWGPRLLRRTDGDWEILGDDESVPVLIGTQEWDSRMAVSPDGRLWVALGGPWPLGWHRELGTGSIAATLDGLCAGVLSYDGTNWSHHLAGACVSDISAAPNGDVWVTVLDIDPAWIDDLGPSLREAAASQPSLPAGIYVITPEAVAATE